MIFAMIDILISAGAPEGRRDDVRSRRVQQTLGLLKNLHSNHKEFDSDAILFLGRFPKPTLLKGEYYARFI